MSPRPAAWLPIGAVVVTLLLWSSAFVAIRHLGSSFSPGALSLGRLVVGALALGAVVAVRRVRDRAGGRPTRMLRPAARDWPALVAIGVLWYGVYNLALNAGEHRVDAGTASLLIQLSPVLVAVLAVLLLGERATVALGVGLVLALGGVALIALSTSGGSDHDLLGVLLCLVSAAVYAISAVLQKPVMSRLPALMVTWVACTVGAVVCLPFLGELVHDTRAASAGDIGWVVYLGLFPTAVAFTTLTVLLGWAFLSETPPAAAYAGGVLCLVGVAVARRRPRVREREAAPVG